MLSVFRYTFKKLIFKPSTIFLTGFGLFMVYMNVQFAGRLTRDALTSQEIILAIHYAIVMPFWSTILWILLPIFCGLKAISYLADEIEDGSFLTIISKPISRTQILIEKFLSYQFMMVLWTLMMISVAWAWLFGSIPYKATTEFFYATFFPMFFIVFVLQVLLSTVLIFLSMKMKPGVIVGLSGFFGLFSQIAPRLIQTSVTQNADLQSSGGLEITKEKYDKVFDGQKLYDSYIKYFDYNLHFGLMFYSQFSDIYKKYNQDSLLEQAVNRKVILGKSKKVGTDELGKKVLKDNYYVQGFSNWLDKDLLAFFYFFAALVAVAFGYWYFWKRDIV